MSNVTAIRSADALPAEDVYLSPEQVSEMVPGLSVRSLRQMRADGKGPRFLKPAPRTVVYLEADVRAWMRTTLHATREQG